MCHEFAYPFENAKELGIVIEIVACDDAPLIECVMRSTPIIRINRWYRCSVRQMAQAIEAAVQFIQQFAAHLLALTERTVVRLPAYCVAA